MAIHGKAFSMSALLTSFLFVPVLKPQVSPMPPELYSFYMLLKWYYDQNCDSPIKTIFEHKQVVGMRSKILLYIF